MESRAVHYHLVHVITGGEFLKPLVVNQVFERAHTQALTPGYGKPISVSVWILEPMRVFLSKYSATYVRNLRRQFPNINIQIFGGINRWGNFPMRWMLFPFLSKRNGIYTIFHCRGESSFELLKSQIFLHSAYRFLVDIRGYWPLELLSKFDVFSPEKAESSIEVAYTDIKNRFDRIIKNVHGVFTVSNPLKQFLIKEHDISSDVTVVPCCVESAFSLEKRDLIRNQLGISGKNAFLYLGSVTRYQHIEDLVLPFMYALTRASKENVAVLLTQDIEAMKSLVRSFDFPKDQIIVRSVLKNEINDFTSAMDAGLLLRAPSLLNSFAQPVKFGEYLANGLPVIVESGTGEVGDLVNYHGIGRVVSTYNMSTSEIDRQAFEITRWIEKERQTLSYKTRNFISKEYTWRAYLEIERSAYIMALG